MVTCFDKKNRLRFIILFFFLLSCVQERAYFFRTSCCFNANMRGLGTAGTGAGLEETGGLTRGVVEGKIFVGIRSGICFSFSLTTVFNSSGFGGCGLCIRSALLIAAN